MKAIESVLLISCIYCEKEVQPRASLLMTSDAKPLNVVNWYPGISGQQMAEDLGDRTQGWLCWYPASKYPAVSPLSFIPEDIDDLLYNHWYPTVQYLRMSSTHNRAHHCYWCPPMTTTVVITTDTLLVNIRRFYVFITGYSITWYTTVIEARIEFISANTVRRKCYVLITGYIIQIDVRR